ncbi:putative uncharacterized protein [Pseudarthrobacter siccitolerans]|uniref:Uncharacterized protein n=1 Tax=Pseudarthrobacter siccitolerans TaxID=861266 RepID=A0A024GX98_9MICC|nr:putative uncharacterized protein [Pseudarthrobacter siccitolerans]
MDPIFVFEGSLMPAGRGGCTVWLLEDAMFGPPEYPLPAR